MHRRRAVAVAATTAVGLGGRGVNTAGSAESAGGGAAGRGPAEVG
jgi:hypothetical protein